jgi:hypothetical protein
MNTRRIFFAFTLLIVIVGFFYLLSPWVTAIVLHYRMSRYVKIRIDYPGCVPGTQAPDSLKCQCEFVFENIKRPGELTFESSSFRQSYDPASRTYSVSGTGTIRDGSNRVVISAGRISINGTELPPDRTPYHALIHSDGSLTNSYMDIAW